MEIKESQDFRVLLRREGWHGAIVAVAVVPKDQTMGGPTAHDHPWPELQEGEVVQEWPCVFLGSALKMDCWAKAVVGYHGIPLAVQPTPKERERD